MEFSIFANKLKKIIGGSSNTTKFTKTIFETMMNDSGPDLIENYSNESFKKYFNGGSSISKIASIVLSNLNDNDEFVAYLNGFGETTAQLLADEFSQDIPDINAVNASIKINDLFLDILHNSSNKKKSTHKSAKKSVHIEPIEIPNKQPSDNFPYSSEDKSLLDEFTMDYDDILLPLIGENYGHLLCDMSLPQKIQSLYQSKWKLKADNFVDLNLKSYVFGVIGELNKLSCSFLNNSAENPSLTTLRKKLRNLYIKLHPNSFSPTYPYEAFIDDWNDGEF